MSEKVCDRKEFKNKLGQASQQYYVSLDLCIWIELYLRYFCCELGLTIPASLREITGLYECILVNVCY